VPAPGIRNHLRHGRTVGRPAQLGLGPRAAADQLDRVAAPARVHRANVTAYLAASADEWDLVFLDPPYDLADDELTRALVALAPRLHPDATVIVERAKRSAAPEWAAAGLEAERDRAYGDTTMWWGRPRGV